MTKRLTNYFLIGTYMLPLEEEKLDYTPYEIGYVIV